MKFIYLYALITIETILLVSELAGSQLTHSLMILTDAYHTLFNILSIVLLIISHKMSNQTTVKNTFGWARIEVLGMLVNMTFLVALTFSLLVEGIQQLVHSSHEITQPTNYYLLYIFGVFGLISNILYFFLVSDAIMSQTKQRKNSLKPQEKVKSDTLAIEMSKPSTSAQKEVTDKEVEKQEEVNKMSSIADSRLFQKNVFFGMFRDLIGSILLILCGVCIMFTDSITANLIDPIFGIVSALVFCVTFYPNLRNTGLILLQTVPENINVSQLKVDILKEFPIILNIHDLHVWGLTASRIIATCHIVLPQFSTKSYEHFSKLLEDFFQRQGIILATVQPEFCEYNASGPQLSCLMKCSKFSKVKCDSYTCCDAFKSDNQSIDKDLESEVSHELE